MICGGTEKIENLGEHENVLTIWDSESVNRTRLSVIEDSRLCLKFDSPSASS